MKKEKRKKKRTQCFGPKTESPLIPIWTVAQPFIMHEEPRSMALLTFFWENIITVTSKSLEGWIILQLWMSLRRGHRFLYHQRPLNRQILLQRSTTPIIGQPLEFQSIWQTNQTLLQDLLPTLTWNLILNLQYLGPLDSSIVAMMLTVVSTFFSLAHNMVLHCATFPWYYIYIYIYINLSQYFEINNQQLFISYHCIIYYYHSNPIK